MRRILLFATLLLSGCGKPIPGGFSAAPSIREQGQTAFNKTDQRLRQAGLYYDSQYQACHPEPQGTPRTKDCENDDVQLGKYIGQLSSANVQMYPARLLYDPINNGNATQQQLDALKKQLALVDAELDKLVPKP